MIMRVEIEKREIETLSKYAFFSKNTIGREKYEKKCKIRTEFQRDRDKIIHSKAFRRLKHKTQVFISPEGDHFRTRLTHTLEVSQIARTIGRALSLNEDLIEAISLGHDLGHTPFGHTGEKVLNELHPKGFNHNEQSIRVVEILEYRPDKPGLNLTKEVKEGIKNHSGDEKPESLEGQVVKYADRIAYINHDIDDAIRAGIISNEDIPDEYLEVLGNSHSIRINNMILDIVKNSLDKDRISMSYEFEYYMDKLRDFMFEKVYLDSIAKSQESKAEYVIKELYKYYLTTGELPDSHKKIYENINSATKDDMICDYIAGMTDRYAINKFKDLFIPESWDEF